MLYVYVCKGCPDDLLCAPSIWHWCCGWVIVSFLFPRGVLLWTLKRCEKAALLQLFFLFFCLVIWFFGGSCHVISSSVELYLASPRSSLNVLGCNLSFRISCPLALFRMMYILFVASRICSNTWHITKHFQGIGMIFSPFTEKALREMFIRWFVLLNLFSTF